MSDYFYIFQSQTQQTFRISHDYKRAACVCVCVDEGKKRRVKCESFSFSFPSSAQCKFPHTPFFPFARFPSSRTEHVCYDSDEAIKGWLLLLIPFHNAILLLLLDFRESVGNRLRSFPQQQKQKKKLFGLFKTPTRNYCVWIIQAVVLLLTVYF